MKLTPINGICHEVPIGYQIGYHLISFLSFPFNHVDKGNWFYSNLLVVAIMEGKKNKTHSSCFKIV